MRPELTTRFTILAVVFSSQEATAEGVTGFRSTTQFRHFFPQYSRVLQKILHENCTVQYQTYLYNTPENSTIDWFGGGGKYSTLTQPVAGGLLEAIPQFIMSNMQSSQVLLGLAPTIMALWGPSSEESATLVVVGRRPLLSLLLALGSPSAYFGRACEFKNPLEILRKKEWETWAYPSTPTSKALVLGLEYLAVLGAVLNLAMMNWHLVSRSVCAFSSEFMYMPVMWSVSMMIVNLIGVWWHSLRVQRKRVRRTGTWVDRIATMLQYEFRLSVDNPGPIHAEQLKEGKLSVFLGWFLSAGSVLHIVFGTLLLSSLLFIRVQDALAILGRMMASVLTCRAITMYELSGLRERFEDSSDKGTELVRVGSRESDRSVVQIGMKKRAKTMPLMSASLVSPRSVDRSLV
ncbi:hypothetical protein B0T21DRAFT_289260 [Apiosordaria backusii]|uniref:Gustatory receptor n=1 Tax=Apiosordaria backusii TaxID=314023 RepID=A0AA40EG09_9PEZI|nr:hypothetical protein B0T21DRAFT_289260 [Apiosordaria backusii]